MDFAISLLKLVPTNAKVNNKVIPKPNEITVIGVILLVWVIFLIATFKEIPKLELYFLSKNIVTFDKKKNTIKQKKKEAK